MSHFRITLTATKLDGTVFQVTIRFGLCRQDDFGKVTAVSGQDRINIDGLLGRLGLPASEFGEWR